MNTTFRVRHLDFSFSSSSTFFLPYLLRWHLLFSDLFHTLFFLFSLCTYDIPEFLKYGSSSAKSRVNLLVNVSRGDAQLHLNFLLAFPIRIIID